MCNFDQFSGKVVDARELVSFLEGQIRKHEDDVNVVDTLDSVIDFVISHATPLGEKVASSKNFYEEIADAFRRADHPPTPGAKKFPMVEVFQDGQWIPMRVDFVKVGMRYRMDENLPDSTALYVEDIPIIEPNGDFMIPTRFDVEKLDLEEFLSTSPSNVAYTITPKAPEIEDATPVGKDVVKCKFPVGSEVYAIVSRIRVWEPSIIYGILEYNPVLDSYVIGSNRVGIGKYRYTGSNLYATLEEAENAIASEED